MYPSDTHFSFQLARHSAVWRDTYTQAAWTSRIMLRRSFISSNGRYNSSLLGASLRIDTWHLRAERLDGFARLRGKCRQRDFWRAAAFTLAQSTQTAQITSNLHKMESRTSSNIPVTQTGQQKVRKLFFGE